MIWIARSRSTMAALTVAVTGFALAALAPSGAAPSVAAPAPAQAIGDAVKGKATFARCAMCHSAAPGAPNKIGPNLAGVIGRKAGAMPGFAYSPAMKASGLKWDAATIDRFLQGPTKLVPGTKMMAPPVAAPQDRADIIAYLKTFNGGKK